MKTTRTFSIKRKLVVVVFILMEITEAADLTPAATETVPSPIWGSAPSPILGTYGANPEIITGMDPELYRAAFKGDAKAFEQVQDIELQLTPNKNTVLHVHFTAETVSKDFVEFIINLRPTLVVQANSKGETPLHMAARYGHVVAAETLIERAKAFPEDLESGIGAELKLIRATNQVGDSALHEAVRYKHIEVVKLLIREDADHSYSANNDGETPLYLAAERRYEDIAYFILENCQSPAYSGPEGRTALHVAVVRKDEEMVKRLLEKEELKSSIKEADKRGCLPLHLAVANEETDIIKLLLEHDRNTAYMRDKEGRTALHLAARMRNSVPMEVILSYCPDCAEIVDSNGQNALHYTFSYDYGLGTNTIMRNESLSNLYNEKDLDGNTPLHLFCSLDWLPFHVPKLIKHQRVDKLAFNKNNLTAYDIIDHQLTMYTKRPSSGLKELKVERLRIIKDSLVKYGAVDMRNRQIKTLAKKKDDDEGYNKDYGDEDNDNIQKNDEDEDPFVKGAKDSHLIVATLIATVTFAAGFTLPGGTIQEGDHQGTPILKNNAAFQAFIVSDTIAMILSTIAVVIHFFLAALKEKDTRAQFLEAAFFMTMFAMASMIIAFVTGISAMLGVSSGLGVAIILIGLSFFIPCFSSVKTIYREELSGGVDLHRSSIYVG